MFDEDFFAYLEDVDFNMRAVRAGFCCSYIPDAIVYHIGSATTGSKINKTTVKLTTRNNIFVICKNYSWPMLLRFLPAMLVYQFFWLVFVVKKRQFIGYMEGVVDSFSKIGRMRKKGLDASCRSLSTAMFCRRITDSEKEVVGSIMSRRDAEGKNNTLLRWYLTIFC
jgi:GT2 family glycosyltransferase